MGSSVICKQETSCRKGQLMKSDRNKEDEGKTRERSGGISLRVGNGSLKRHVWVFFLFLFLMQICMFHSSKVLLCAFPHLACFPPLSMPTHTHCVILSLTIYFLFPASRKTVLKVMGLIQTLWQR